MISINDIANQLAADLALREARIREAGITLARIESDITKAQDEAAQVKRECKDAIDAAKKERAAFEQRVTLAKANLEMAQSALKVTQEKCVKEIDAHVTKINELKGQYAALDRDERDNIARLVETRASIKAEIRALVDKLKGLA
jgi:phage-related minor tail protein